MDGFGSDNEIDPAAEFIAREQNQLAGLEDEVSPAVSNVITNGTDTSNDFEFISSPSATTNNYINNEQTETNMYDNDPFSTSTQPPPLHDSSYAFSNTDPDTSTNNIMNEDNFLPSTDVDSNVFSQNDDSVQPALNGHSSPYEDEDIPAPIKTPPIREEAEKIKKWREDQKKMLEIKDAEEEKKKEEMRKTAKKELEEWYRHHEDTISKTKAANRNAEKQFVAESDEIVPGTEWERISKLCDFNAKVGRSSKDTSRMRSIILQLKQNPIKGK